MKNKGNNKLAVKMLIAMIAGIAVGLIFMAIRESMGADSATWKTINNLLFQDITAPGAESCSKHPGFLCKKRTAVKRFF